MEYRFGLPSRICNAFHFEKNMSIYGRIMKLNIEVSADQTPTNKQENAKFWHIVQLLLYR